MAGGLKQGAGGRKSGTPTGKHRTQDAVITGIVWRPSVPGEKKKTALAREKKPAANAADDESRVIDRAVEVIGDKNEAMRWMGTPVRALGYSTPVSLLGTRKGRQAIITVLGRLQHGVL
jgi:uncharacterized protein (DUF2384 family)